MHSQPLYDASQPVRAEMHERHAQRVVEHDLPIHPVWVRRAKEVRDLDFRHKEARVTERPETQAQLRVLAPPDNQAWIEAADGSEPVVAQRHKAAAKHWHG